MALDRSGDLPERSRTAAIGLSAAQEATGAIGKPSKQPGEFSWETNDASL